MASVYDSEDVATLWGRIVAYLLEQGGFHVSKERPSKCSVKIERRACSRRSGFLVKVRVYAVDADKGLLAVEWQRFGCAVANHAASCKFLSRFAQPLD